MSLQEAGYGSEEGQLGSEISGAVSGVTTPGASRLQASQSQERSATMQRLHYPSLQGLPYPYVCYVCLCVSHFSPRRGSWRPGFADVGPKVLIRYYYHSYGAQFLCWRLSLGNDGKPYLLEGRGGQVC